MNTIVIRTIQDLVSRVNCCIYIWCCSGCWEILFLRLLCGAGRFFCPLALYAQFEVGSPIVFKHNGNALLEYKVRTWS
jgi:hypothetical protein